jgi:hypothetical protein
MIRIGTALLCAVFCDLVVLLGAPPLVQYSIAASRSPETSFSQLLLLLVANLALLGLCLCGAAAWVYALGRVAVRR